MHGLPPGDGGGVVTGEATAVVDAGEPDRTVPDVAAACLGRPQPNRLAAQGFAEEDEVALPFDLAVGTDASDLDIAPVPGLTETSVPWTRRAAIGGDRRPLPERLVRAVVVVAVLEGFEAVDLGARRAGSRSPA